MCSNTRMIELLDFYSPELNNKRCIRIYLPISYQECTDKRYSVLYMHDGQNLFDVSASGGWLHPWGVDSAIDELVRDNRIEEVIVVGIDNNENRGSEYCHFECTLRHYGRLGDYQYQSKKGVKGIEYERFLIETLKPYIDSYFRTLPGPENTGLMGSSLGGLVSFQIGLRHPEVFGKLGVISPAFHWTDFSKIPKLMSTKTKIWMDAGEGEAYYVDNARIVLQDLLNQGIEKNDRLAYYQVPNAIHNELDWSARIKFPLLYLFGDLGKAVSCELVGRKVIGLQGVKSYVNAIVTYESGFKKSDIDGHYLVKDPAILSILPDGSLVPKKCGKTKVRYEKDGVFTECEYEVIEKLSEMITLIIDVKVPTESEESDAKIYIYADGFTELKKINDGIYRYQTKIPRDWGFPFNISRGEQHQGEADKQGKPIGTRMIMGTKSILCQVGVAGWLD